MAPTRITRAKSFPQSPALYKANLGLERVGRETHERHKSKELWKIPVKVLNTTGLLTTWNKLQVQFGSVLLLASLHWPRIYFSNRNFSRDLWIFAKGQRVSKSCGRLPGQEKTQQRKRAPSKAREQKTALCAARSIPLQCLHSHWCALGRIPPSRRISCI